jgi:uncharacterized protein with PIN domain
MARKVECPECHQIVAPDHIDSIEARPEDDSDSGKWRCPECGHEWWEQYVDIVYREISKDE